MLLERDGVSETDRERGKKETLLHGFIWGAKGESKWWARAPLICGWRGHQELLYNNYIRVKWIPVSESNTFMPCRRIPG